MNAKGKAVVLILILLIGAGIWLIWGRGSTPIEPIEVPPSITDETINEPNFSGSRPVISGDSAVAQKAEKYIDQLITDFKKRADEEVPQIREDFGNDVPSATYTVDVKAEYVQSPVSESIVISEYYYTGGANGTGSYSVFTSSGETGEILSLRDVIKEEKREDFLSLVKAKLISWRPEGSETLVVFPEEVSALSFDSFENWSIDDENLTIYFDEYEIGPGVLGAIAFPIPLSELQEFLSESFVFTLAESSMKGCYVARLGEDIYTLKIENENNDIISGLLSYNNYQKDSSAGVFSGTYKDDILLGDYSFFSEGMFSIREVIFKKEGNTFIQGFGPVETEGNKETFIDIKDIYFDTNSIFIKEDCNE